MHFLKLHQKYVKQLQRITKKETKKCQILDLKCFLSLCVKSVYIRRHSGSHFSRIFPHSDEKNAERNNYEYDIFYTANYYVVSHFLITTPWLPKILKAFFSGTTQFLYIVSLIRVAEKYMICVLSVESQKQSPGGVL